LSILYLNNDKKTVTAAYYNGVKLNKVYKGNTLVWNFEKSAVDYTILKYNALAELIGRSAINANIYLKYATPSSDEKGLNRFDAYGVKAYGPVRNELGTNSYGIVSAAKQIYFNADMSEGQYYFRDINTNAYNIIRDNEVVTLNHSEFEKHFKYVQNAYNLFYRTNMAGSVVQLPSAVNMYMAFAFCNRLTDSPYCGNSVTDLTQCYRNCFNLTGSPVLGSSVVYANDAYANCRNLSGSPVMQSSIVYMANLYMGCTNLRGEALFSSSAVTASRAYQNCPNIYQIGTIPETMQDLSYCFYRTPNVQGSVYFPSVNHTVNIEGFVGYGRNSKSPRLTFYAEKYSSWWYAIKNFVNWNNDGYFTNTNLYFASLL
jgi:hypothetical protein